MATTWGEWGYCGRTPSTEGEDKPVGRQLRRTLRGWRQREPPLGYTSWRRAVNQSLSMQKGNDSNSTGPTRIPPRNPSLPRLCSYSNDGARPWGNLQGKLQKRKSNDTIVTTLSLWERGYSPPATQIYARRIYASTYITTNYYTPQAATPKH
jgi:hypothetical protein